MFSKGKLFWLSILVSMALAGCSQANQQNIAAKDTANKTPVQLQENLKREDSKRIAEAIKRQTERDQEVEEVAKVEAAKDQPVSRPSNIQNIFSEYWIQFLGVIMSVLAVVVAVSGFSLSGKKKQKMLKKLMHEIDDTYGSFQQKSKRCEAELYRLQDVIEDNLKEGRIDENTFQLLEKRIEKYLSEVKNAEK